MYVESSLRKKPFIDFLRNGFRARFFPHIFRDDDNDERQKFSLVFPLQRTRGGKRIERRVGWGESQKKEKFLQ
jgi:hypothetical protein